MIITDIFSKNKRSKIMAKVKGKNTKPEIIVRKFLFSKGFRYRINDKRYPGKPDILLPKYRTVIFVHGCFWHGHDNCLSAKLPQTNKEFWENKIAKNKERDKKVIDCLSNEGWNVIVVWECEINTVEKRENRLNSLIKEIKGHHE